MEAKTRRSTKSSRHKDKEKERKHHRRNKNGATSWCGKIGWLRLGAAYGRREGLGVRGRGAHALSLRLGGLETLRRRRQNTAGTMENKPTQGKTGLSHRRPRGDRRRCGAARPGATKPRPLYFALGRLKWFQTWSTLTCVQRVADHHRQHALNTTALCSYKLGVD